MDDKDVVSVRVHLTITGHDDVQVLNEQYSNQHEAMYAIAEAFDMDTAMLGDPVVPGDVLRGFCGGLFGRDALLDKTVEAIEPDWCVVREPDGRKFFATSQQYLPIELIQYRVQPEEQEDEWYDDHA